MILTILGDCYKQSDVPLTPLVDEFSLSVTIPSDYVPGEGRFEQWYIPRPGRWVIRVTVTSGSFTVDYGDDPDNIRSLLGFGHQWSVAVSDQFVLGLFTNQIVTGPENDPHAIRFEPVPVDEERYFARLGGQGGCFPTEEDYLRLQILLFGFNVPVLAPDGITYIPQDYGYPASITVKFDGALVEAAP